MSGTDLWDGFCVLEQGVRIHPHTKAFAEPNYVVPEVSSRYEETPTPWSYLIFRVMHTGKIFFTVEAASRRSRRGESHKRYYCNSFRLWSSLPGES